MKQIENWKVTAKKKKKKKKKEEEEYLKNHQMEILELKNAITKIENILDSIAESQ